jgi:TolB-like protein
MCLRVGAHVADVIVDERDIYGAGVNLAARLTTLAGPGEIVVSAEVRGLLTPGLDAEIEDLGDCFLKHLETSVRAYRLGAPGRAPVIHAAPPEPKDMLPTVAVVPFSARNVGPSHAALGDALADELIAGLSQTPALHVISRLSTTAFRDGRYSLGQMRDLLKAAYVISGAYSVHGDEVRVQAELCDTGNQRVLWATSQRASIAEIFLGEDRIVPEIVANASTHILDRELQRARTLPLPSLNHYTLYVGGVALLHRLSAREFSRSREMLQHLAERVPRSAAPHAMLAKWHVLQMVQGWANDPQQERLLARASANRALDIDPGHSLGLAVDGLVAVHSDGDLITAHARYTAALDANPQEPLAWALIAGLHSFRGEGVSADAAADKALALSPLDPTRFLLESYAALAKLSAHKHDEAIALARSSVKHNKLHLPSHRILVLALSLAGDRARAREAMDWLKQVDSGFNLREFRRRYPGHDAPHMPEYVEAFRAAGVPE